MPMQGVELEPYVSSSFQMTTNNNMTSSNVIDTQATNFSSPAASGSIAYDSSSAISGSASRSPFSTHSLVLDPINSSSDYPYGSPISGSSSVAYEDSEQWNKLRELEILLLGPESDATSDTSNCCGSGANSYGQWNRSQMLETIPKLDLKQLLELCAEVISFGDENAVAANIMEELEKRVSVSGDPVQRLGAYMLEGLRARLESSGSLIYRKLKCEEPTSSELMSYMSVLYQICPYWKFAYESANVMIWEATRNEPRIHIIDFQITQGNQWVQFMEGLKARLRGGYIPSVRITGVDDSQSAQARGGGLELVGRKLEKVAESFGIPFEFHNAAMSGHEVQYENLGICPGEAIAVNIPYALHHIPDESVSVENHRDRLIRLVKSLSPKVVTLVEQESNTNTSPFFPRFREILDYYLAMFESIDAGSSRGSMLDSRKRISAEQNCVARDIVNMVACEGPDRIERHELFGKWRLRLSMAGFQQLRLSPCVKETISGLLQEYSEKFRVEEREGALYLLWLNRAMSTSSAWR